MKKLTFLLIIVAVFSCQKKSETSLKKEEITKELLEDKYFLIPPYGENDICSVFPVNKKGIILERFRVFDNVCSTDVFSRIDSICAIGVKEKKGGNTVYIEHWKLKNYEEALYYKSKLDFIKDINNLQYKPPTFWTWKVQDNVLLFFYSQQVPPSDSFFEYVFNNHQILTDNKNCCELWAK